MSIVTVDENAVKECRFEKGDLVLSRRGSIILVTGPGKGMDTYSGIRIHGSGNHGGMKYSDIWTKYGAELFTGTVTIRNGS